MMTARFRLKVTVLVPAAMATVVMLTGCVETVKFARLPVSQAAATDALESERALTHPATVFHRQGTPPVADRFTFCTRDGQAIELMSARISDEGVCGAVFGGSGRLAALPQRCWRFDEMQVIGKPRDARALGYFPVRAHLRCET